MIHPLGKDSRQITVLWLHKGATGGDKKHTEHVKFTIMRANRGKLRHASLKKRF